MPTETAPADSPEVPAIDTKLVRKLAGILKETDLTEIEVERGDLRIRVARELTAAAPQVAYAPAQAAQPAPTAPAAAGPAPAAEVERSGEVIPSPMVGTVYLQAQPGSEPFIRVGTVVVEGQTLLIVEAMKTMNPIPAPRGGKITEILVTDSQPVEFGEPLVVIE